jgi:predicted DNA-binding transcriptional regulator AlpA
MSQQDTAAFIRNPADMTAEQRCEEVARLLATAVVRTRQASNVPQESAPPLKTATTRPSQLAIKGKAKQGDRKVQLDDPANPKALLTEKELAQRWSCSTSRLQRWRSEKQGPIYMKIGNKVLYRLADIEAFEQQCLVSNAVAMDTAPRTNTSK